DPLPQGARTVEPGPDHAFRPAQRRPTPELIASLTHPPDVAVGVFAEELKNPRMLAVSGDGTVYVTSPDDGTVVALADRDGDGKAEERRVVVQDLADVHGIAIHEGKIYLAPPEQVLVAELRADGTIGPRSVLIEKLPEGSGHKDRTLGFGP